MSFTNLLVPKSAGLSLELGEHAFGSLKSSAGLIRDPKMLPGRGVPLPTAYMRKKENKSACRMGRADGGAAANRTM
jgi:hypothetical protein